MKSQIRKLLQGKDRAILKLLFTPAKLIWIRKGVKVLDEEWDYLIVLDACRYDYFEKYNFIDGDLQKVNSVATYTLDWVIRNFRGRNCKDIVYVSTNPYVSNTELIKYIGYNLFYHIEPVWEYDWDDKLGTVPPEAVTEAAIKCKNKFPDKRMIVHYMQPHSPYLDVPDFPKFWEMGTLGVRRNKKVITGLYISNLKKVLKEVEGLIKHLEGKIIITSDHGEMFGEYFISGHDSDLFFKELREVPWLIINKPKSTKRDEKERIREIVERLKRNDKI